MIKLELEKYCQECTCFEEKTNYLEYMWQGKFCRTYTITCKNKDICKNLKEYLKKQGEKKND